MTRTEFESLSGDLNIEAINIYYRNLKSDTNKTEFINLFFDDLYDDNKVDAIINYPSIIKHNNKFAEYLKHYLKITRFNVEQLFSINKSKNISLNILFSLFDIPNLDIASLKFDKYVDRYLNNHLLSSTLLFQLGINKLMTLDDVTVKGLIESSLISLNSTPAHAYFFDNLMGSLDADMFDKHVRILSKIDTKLMLFIIERIDYDNISNLRPLFNLCHEKKCLELVVNQKYDDNFTKQLFLDENKDHLTNIFKNNTSLFETLVEMYQSITNYHEASSKYMNILNISYIQDVDLCNYSSKIIKIIKHGGYVKYSDHEDLIIEIINSIAQHRQIDSFINNYDFNKIELQSLLCIYIENNNITPYDVNIISFVKKLDIDPSLYDQALKKDTAVNVLNQLCGLNNVIEINKALVSKEHIESQYHLFYQLLDGNVIFDNQIELI